MYAIFLKEIRQFFGSLTGIVAISVFLIVMGLLLFVFPDTSLFDFGYASLEGFFNLAPFVLSFLVPAITMRSYAEEFKSGTWELLATRPLTTATLVSGKFFGALMVGLLALLPTLVYVLCMYWLSEGQQIDGGGVLGSYLGLIALLALFTATSLFCSALSNNAIVGFLLGALGCYLIYFGFDAVSKIPVLAGGADYYLRLLGADAHYRSLSRGLIPMADLFYFIIVTVLMLLLTQRHLLLRQP